MQVKSELAEVKFRRGAGVSLLSQLRISRKAVERVNFIVFA